MKKDKFEETLFSIVTKIPEYFMPIPLRNWMYDHIQKKNRQMQQDIIRLKWQQVNLQKVKKDAQPED